MVDLNFIGFIKYMIHISDVWGDLKFFIFIFLYISSEFSTGLDDMTSFLAS